MLTDLDKSVLGAGSMTLAISIAQGTGAHGIAVDLLDDLTGKTVFRILLPLIVLTCGVVMAATPRGSRLAPLATMLGPKVAGWYAGASGALAGWFLGTSAAFTWKDISANWLPALLLGSFGIAFVLMPSAMLSQTMDTSKDVEKFLFFADWKRTLYRYTGWSLIVVGGYGLVSPFWV